MKFVVKILSVAAVLAFGLMFSGCNDDDDGGLTTGEQFEFENDQIDAYISSNGLDTETDVNSLLRYRVTSEGSGISVAFPINANNKVVDSVTISYTARLLDTEEVVLSASNQKVAYEQLLTGVRLALQFVREGGSINFFVPSAYAFGPNGTGSVPANATLIYDLDLVDIHAQQLFADINAIDDVLADSSMQADENITGLRYIIEEAGSGQSPNWRNVIIVNYTGKILETGEEFDSGTNVGLILQELITGWIIGLQEIETGGTIHLYIPSRMGYGPSGGGPDIPPNSNLYFKVDLISVQ